MQTENPNEKSVINTDHTHCAYCQSCIDIEYEAERDAFFPVLCEGCNIVYWIVTTPFGVSALTKLEFQLSTFGRRYDLEVLRAMEKREGDGEILQ